MLIHQNDFQRKKQRNLNALVPYEGKSFWGVIDDVLPMTWHERTS